MTMKHTPVETELSKGWWKPREPSQPANPLTREGMRRTWRQIDENRGKEAERIHDWYWRRFLGAINAKLIAIIRGDHP